MTSPTVYFIDDSATMREVIKIAFRRENIDVVACHNADAALAQMNEQKPDVVISDVIMPGKDGYEVCQRIKQNPATAGTPVVLMSGVVNKQVAEKAFAVKADELIRKPFQPQDLITRVRHLLNPKAPAQPQPVAAPATAAALSSIFAAQPTARPMAARAVTQPQVAPAMRSPMAPAPTPVATRAVAMTAPVQAQPAATPPQP